MYESILSIFQNAVRPRSILRDVSTYWGFRSTVPGPGHRSAAEFLLRRYQENGVRAEIFSYPADDETEFLDGHKNPLAWFPRHAELHIAAPVNHSEMVCSYAEEPLCLLSNSTSTPPGGLTAEVVVIHNATSAEAYAGVDVKGKIVFTDVWPLLADEQARKHGALGIITDSVTPPWLHVHPPVRSAADEPDLVMWGTLNGHRCENPLWGFSLSPRQGACLRDVIRSRTPDDPVLLRAVVDADLLPGKSELTTALLPGTDLAEQEVWILAHSSEPGAIDNASGCCAALEIARMIRSLTESGALPPLRRSIRFLHAVETEGYLPYLTSLLGKGGLGFEHIVAALAFDSVGADFRNTGGILRINRSPDYNPSFADDLLEAILAAVASMPNTGFTDDPYELFPWQVDACFPGNDNMIADGFFNVPTPMLDCWPDRYYHSNLDTPDKLSVGSMARCTLTAAAYVYGLSTAGIEEAQQMAVLTLQAWKRRIMDGADPLQGMDALQTIQVLEPSLRDCVQDMVAELMDFARRERQVKARWANDDSRDAEEGTAPLFNFPAQLEQGFLKSARWNPPALTNLTEHGQVRLRALRQEHPSIEHVWRLINGRRTAKEICARSELPAAAVVAYLDLLLSESVIVRQEKG